MGNEIPPSNPSSSDEIDLGQLIDLMRKGLNGIFRGILRVFVFLKKNALKLGALIVIGVALGFLLNTLVEEKLRTEIIVKPNFESKDYLYDAVEEIRANILGKDTLFFKELNIDVNQLRNFNVEIEPIKDEIELDKEMAEEANDYLEILQNYKDNDFVLDIIKSEILKKSIRTHRITFSHKNPQKGEEYIAKILEYINSNTYFKNLQTVYAQNASSRIENNENLIGQIDELVMNFSAGQKNDKNLTGQSMVLLDREGGLNIANLLAFKNRLVKEVEIKKVELAEQQEAISILNFGKTHVFKKPFLNKNIVLMPALLLGLFMLVSLVSYLNRKSKEIQ